MNYEPAKQLKDAGFPQPVIGQGAQTGLNDLGKGVYVNDGVDYAYAPTLEELIEACGERFTALECWHGRLAEYRWKAVGFAPAFAEGATPTIAVAKLWLALHANHQS